MSTSIIRALLVLGLVCVVISLDSEAFHRILNGTGLSDYQIDKIANISNGDGKEWKRRNAVLAYIKTFKSNDLKKKAKKAFLNLWNKYVMLDKLSNATINAASPYLNKTEKAKVQTVKKQADIKYKGDFAKVQLEVFQYIVNRAPANKADEVKEKMNKPLNKFNNKKKREQLVKAFNTFAETPNTDH